MGHKDERDREKRQTSIDARRMKPGAARATRSKSARPPADPADPVTPNPTADGDLSDAILADLRKRTVSACTHHMWTTAAFFAEKVATVSNSAADVLTLARVYQGGGNPARALKILTGHGLDRTSFSGLLISAQCLMERGKPTECLELLGDDDSTETNGPIEIRSALCVMRARVHTALDNPVKAESWWRRALSIDAHCVEALLTLTKPGILPRESAAILAQEISASASTTDNNNNNVSSRVAARVNSATGDAHNEVLPALYLSLGDSASSLEKLPSSLQTSIDVSAARVARHFAAFEYETCAELCRDLVRNDPRVGSDIVLTYLGSLVELGERQELFAYAHKLVDGEPREAITWLAVGYYYLASKSFDTARLYLQKATMLDPRLVEAWIALGHAFAGKDESDHSMTAYSTAARLHPGSHFPTFFMGIQHSRQSSIGLATQLFQAASASDSNDPAPCHELGVLAYQAGDFSRAVDYFQTALSLWNRPQATTQKLGARRAEAEEASLVNLGHCFRRLGQYERAKTCYEKALSLYPNCPSTFIALALTMHCAQRYERAIAMYHRALRHVPKDIVANELLDRALKDHVDFGLPVMDEIPEELPFETID